MKPLSLAGLIGLAGLGAQAQTTPYAIPPQPLESVVVTATRSLAATTPTLRDAITITREDLDLAGNQSLAEVLQRRAGIEFRSTGGPGQPTGLMIRGANSAHTLVLVDGIRVSSAIGTTAVENIPLDMIERVEVVKGPLSGLYGADAIGGVVQIFTRGKQVPHFYATAAFGENNEGRVAMGVTGVDTYNSFSINAGGRKVDAPSATNERNFCFDGDRDRYENAFFEVKGAHRLWQGEVLSANAFVTRGKTRFDGCPDSQGRAYDDRNDQTLTGAGLASESQFTPTWKSKLSYNYGLDEIRITGSFPSTFETSQDQLTWVNEFDITGTGRLLAGAEFLRQKILSAGDSPFSRDHRDIDAVFAGLNQAWTDGQRVEMNIRMDRDRDDADFGSRTTGSVSYGIPWPGWGHLSGTWATGFRPPTFFDLYGASSDFYQANPNLRPERSESMELTLRSDRTHPVRWRITAFDNRIEDLIAYVFPTVENVRNARIKGVETSIETAWLGLDWRGTLTVQKPRDDDTGKRLPSRAEQFGSLDLSKRFGDSWTVGATVFGSGDRFDSVDESPSSRLPGYAVLDARVRYKVSPRWFVELTATNLLDKKYESTVGYDAPRRGVMLSVRFDAL